MAEMTGGLWELKQTLIIASKQMRPHSYNCKELDPANTLNELRRQFLLRLFGSEHHTSNTMNVRPRAENPDEPRWTSGLQNCEMINGCCFKPLNW